MRNAKERAEFIENHDNWIVIEQSHYTRLLRIEYKNEYRYMTEIYQHNSYYNVYFSKVEKETCWKFCGYWKENTEHHALEHQSLTQMRDWVFDLDKRFPDKRERKKK